MRKVADAVEDLEAAPRYGLVRRNGVAQRNDRILGTPHEQRRNLRSQVQAVVAAHRLAAEVDDGAQGAKERPAVSTSASEA